MSTTRPKEVSRTPGNADCNTIAWRIKAKELLGWLLSDIAII
jgi:hypothetical protein